MALCCKSIDYDDLHGSDTSKLEVEMFYLNSTLNFGIPPVLVFLLEVYYKVDRFLFSLTAQQKQKLKL